MDEVDKNSEINDIDIKVTVQMITFVVVIMIVIFTLVYFIRIYSTKKERVLKSMATEAILLDTAISDQLNYSKHFISLIGQHIKSNTSDINLITQILKDHFSSKEFNTQFGWRKFSWVNNAFYEITTSTNGIKQPPQYVSYLQNIVQSTDVDDYKEDSKIVFFTKKCAEKGNTLKLIYSLQNLENKNYLGSVILSYDLNTMIKNLNFRKKSTSTNFIIIDREKNVVAKSKDSIDKIINDDDIFAQYIEDILTKSTLNSTDVSDLDMVNGLNYYVKPLADLPFFLIVNIDNNVIKNDILDSVTKKFIEVCIFAVLCLIFIFSIYKRETVLRSRAEKAKAQAINANKAKTDFLSYTAHEIRSPLGFILTGSEVMTKQMLGKLPTKYAKYAQGIHNNSILIRDFITDILDDTQIIEGKFKIINSLVNIEEIINEAIKVNLARFNTRKVKIETDFSSNMPLIICDSRRMLQVMSNLVSNSIKYSEDNTTTKITTQIVDANMEIKVSDQGIGMNPDDIPTALTMYGTVYKSSYHSLGSYGLGLPIVKMLLDAQNAVIDISSFEKKGTIVKVTFPKFKLIYKNQNNGKISG